MSKLLNLKEQYTFDDVLLAPLYSECTPDMVDTTTKLSEKISLSIPIISSAMDTLTDSVMAIHMAINGGLGIIHKNMSNTEQIEQIKIVKNYVSSNLYKTKPNSTVDSNGRLMVGIAVGVGTTEEHILNLLDTAVDVIAVDSAHGDSINVINMVRKIRSLSDIDIIAGNVTSSNGAKRLFYAGANIIKVGIGAGSICTTRIVSGCGYPQLSAIDNMAYVYYRDKITIIADGGIKNSGDITKALAIGADCVMLGSMLSGTTESIGELFVGKDGRKYKHYRGMGSKSAMDSGSKDRYFQSGVESKKLIEEGIEAKVLHKGSLSDVLHNLVGGLKSGMGYCGSSTLKELREKSEFIKITNSGFVEGKPHSVIQNK